MMTTRSEPAENIQDLVVRQFGPRAGAYVGSAVHAQGADLEALGDFLARQRPARMIDLGCGGGHCSFNAAPHAGEVVAYDLSAEMLEAVRAEATARGFANITTRQGPAERLPFPDGAFDAVVSRYSAHHWSSLPAALAEARRVLKPGCPAVFMDVVAPEAPLLDTFLQTLEMLRDPSHVRDYAGREWCSMAEHAGFGVEETVPRRLRLEFASWLARIGTSDVHAAAIRSLQMGASGEVRAHFEIEADGSFTVDTLTLVLRAL